MSIGRLLVAALVGLIVTVGARGDSWPHWRGPNYDGVSAATDLPTDFSPSQHVKWSVDLPGPSAGTPIVTDKFVFVSSADEKANALVAMCFDRATGKAVWQQAVSSGDLSKDRRSNYANPSPVTDGQTVVFLYGNGDVAAFDLAGKELWSANLQKKYGRYGYLWTYGASPTIVDDRVVISVLNQRSSYVLALDLKTGNEAWREPRATNAVKESHDSYATPIPRKMGGRTEVLIAGGDALTGHDPRTGKELWRWETWNPGHRVRSHRLVGSPAVVGDMVIVPAPRGAAVFAIKPGADNAVWESNANRISSDVCTPLFWNSRLYVLADLKRSIHCIDPSNGNVLWSTDLPGRALWRASPLAADGKIWCINHDGLVAIIDPADGKIINEIDMGSGDRAVRSTLVAVDKQLFIRTDGKLYCIEK